MVTRGVPYFSLFRFDGRYPAIADRALEPLRRFERQKGSTHRTTVFTVVQEVGLSGSGFDGLLGVVAGAKGRMVSIIFEGRPSVVDVDPRRLIT